MKTQKSKLLSEYLPEILLFEQRSGLTELEFCGFVVHCDKNKNLTVFGNTQNYPFFHRSCAKPLQASIICDFGTKSYYNLTDEEIAVCCASHTGEKLHINLIKSLMKKANIAESSLKCPVIAPLDEDEQKNLHEFSPFHNNCSGKHALMLAVCKQKGWKTDSYLEKEHPLQQYIYKKLKKLCEIENELPFTLDGCTAPNWATPLENLAIGFWNLFFCPEYAEIQKAFCVNPHILGGKNRLDTQIMQMNPKLCAKVGAGGLCYVANTVTKEVLGFKITDANMLARSIVVIETLISIGWLDINSIDEKLLNNSLNKFVKTETGEIVGDYYISQEYSDFLNRKF